MDSIVEAQEGKSKFCQRCHRLLKDPISKARGYGQVCYQKMLDAKPKGTPLFSVSTKKGENSNENIR